MQTFNAYTTTIYTPKECCCPVCSKVFYPESTQEWVYKIKKDLYCSWKCFRVVQKKIEAEQDMKRHPNAKLTDEQKAHIQLRIKQNNALPDAERLSNTDLAKELNVSPATIRKYIEIVNWVK